MNTYYVLQNSYRFYYNGIANAGWPWVSIMDNALQCTTIEEARAEKIALDKRGIIVKIIKISYSEEEVE